VNCIYLKASIKVKKILLEGMSPYKLKRMECTETQKYAMIRFITGNLFFGLTRL